MPLYPDALVRIRTNLSMLETGQRPPVIAIGYFTPSQFREINAAREHHRLPPIAENEIVFMGRHLFESRRLGNGYTIDDILTQIQSAMSSSSRANVHSRMTAIENPAGRQDGYGNTVHDQAIFECTARKPRAELYSVIPEGDGLKRGMRIQDRASR